MIRRHKVETRENHERWLVSYADFITLLFAFFVVMFAASHTDKKKAKAVSDAVREALETGELRSVVAGLVGRPVNKFAAGARVPNLPDAHRPSPGEVAPELGPSLQFLEHALAAELAAGQVQLKMEPRGLVISLREAAFFPSGGDTIRPSSYASLEKITVALRRIPNALRLEGHTDAVPIHTSRFRSNWELSAARSISMLELLAGRFGLPRERFAVVGYAETAPVDSNDTADGRARNRRVDVVILAHEAANAEPARAAAVPRT